MKKQQSGFTLIELIAVIVVLGILGVVLFGLEAKGIRIVGDIPKGLPKFELPVGHWGKIDTRHLADLHISQCHNSCMEQSPSMMQRRKNNADPFFLWKDS